MFFHRMVVRQLLLCVMAALAAAPSWAADALASATAESSTPPGIEEVEVTGVHPGPGLWRVTRGDHVLWLLGTIDPLPRKMEWKSQEVESVLSEAQELVYEQPSVNVHGNPITWIRAYFDWRHVQTIAGDETLKDWISPDSYSRFTALEARFDPHDRRTEKLRPVFAALRLYGRALEASNLTPGDQTEQAVLKLAHKHHVRIRQPKLTIDDPRGLILQLGEISRAAHAQCLQAIIERLETDLEPMKVAARAWAVGDVGALRKLPYPKDIEVCTDSVASSPRLKELVSEAKSGWDSELDAALARNRTTLAMQSVYDLLSPMGTLAKLQAKGYQLEGP